ncbi:excalibur calcium-binding domain-containing protein [Haloarcula sp. 1CSR25-25]|uniref:excalibur calcium-binding domain-containing protein n=1 Tax=Haloarcula sp. 1CSR25-25 TaxID=2862545 RepID=UPI002893B461|nr:excalibur calcium-binding domain-containing protein [Haloarcula sp. 1CSR25-25]MDT3435532.1 excalibur calcium-binding domain-containing protein [Haloarcula sp. 1CSR25-25]
MHKGRLLVIGVSLVALASGVTDLLNGNISQGVFAVGLCVVLGYSLKISTAEDPVAGGIVFVVLLVVLGGIVGAIGLVPPLDTGDVFGSDDTETSLTPEPSAIKTDTSAKSSGYSGDYDCDDFSSQSAAQDVYEESGGAHGLDGDDDGKACEHLP